jgi:hypothetical protein
MICADAYSQTPEWKWLKRGGGTGTWTTGSGHDDKSTGVVTDKFGNVTVCGRFFNSGSTNIDGDLVNRFGDWDGFVAQYDCSGNSRWKYSFGGKGSDEGSDIAIDSLGNVYVTGQISQSPQIGDSIRFGDTTFFVGGSHSFVAMIDTSGNVIWLKVAYSGQIGASSRGLSIDCNNERVNVLLRSGGWFKEYASGDTVEPGYIIASYYLDGSLSNVFKAYDYGSKLDLRDISIDENHHTYITGTVEDSINIGGSSFDPKNSVGEAIVLRFSKYGTFVWGTMSTPPGTINLVHGWEIEAISDYVNSFYLVGNAYEDAAFGHIPITNSESMTGYVVKYINGAPIWLINVKNNTANNQIYNINIGPHDNISIAGTILGMGIIGGDTLKSKDIQDPFIAKFDKFGNGIYAKTIPCKGDYGNIPFGIAAGHNGNVFLTGTFESRIELPNDSVYSQGGNSDFFLAKYGIDECEDTTTKDTADFISENRKFQQLSIYPNPSSGQFRVDLNEYTSGQLQIYNSLGSIVYGTRVEGSNQIIINLPPNIKSGIYIVKLTTETSILTQKLLLQKD